MATRISGITIEIGGDTSDLQKALKGLDKQLSSTKNELKDIDKLLKIDPGNTDLLRQKQERLGAAIKGTSERLEELKKAQAQVDEGTSEWDALQREIVATQGDLESLQKQMKEFGSVSAQKLKAVGESMQTIGGKVTDLGQKLTPVSAAAGGLVTGLLKLGYDAAQTADELATLSQQTGISTDELQKMQYASDLVDVSVSDMTGALEKLKPKITEDNEALKKLGVETKNVDGTTRNATDVFYDTLTALSKISNETERDQLAMEIFGKSASSLAGIIDDGGLSLKEYGQEAENLGLIMSEDTISALNEANNTFDRMKGTMKASLTELGATVLQTLAPSIEKLSGFIATLTEKIRNLTPEQAQMILKVGAIVAAIAPLLTIGGKLVSGIGTVLKMAPKIKTAITLVTSALSPTTLIIGAVVAAVVALGVIIYKNWDKISSWTKDMVDKVKGFFENMKTSITNITSNISSFVAKAWEGTKTTISNIADGIKKTAVTAWDNVKSATTKTFDAVKKTVSDKMSAAKKAFDDNGGGIKGAAAAMMEGVKGYYTAGFDFLNNLTGGKLDGIKTLFSTTFEAVKTSISSTWDSIKTTASSKIESIKTTVSTAFTNIVEKIKSIMKFDFKLPTLSLPTWESMKSHFDGLIQTIKNAFKFDWSLPHVKLPHFRVSGGKWPYGLGGEGWLPSISIDWYKKAYENAVMFTSPTVMATPYGYKGFGDGTGAEIVMGLNKLQELVGGSRPIVVNVYGTSGQSVDALADAVTRRIVNLQKQRTAAYA